MLTPMVVPYGGEKSNHFDALVQTELSVGVQLELKLHWNGEQKLCANAELCLYGPRLILDFYSW